VSGPLSRRFPLLLLARRNLARARVRTVLATLGIVVGVVAVSGLGVFGVAFYQAQVSSYQDTMASVAVYPGADAETGDFDGEQLARIRAAAPDEATVVALDAASMPVEYGRERTTTRVKGLTRPHAELTAARGEIPQPWRSGVLVGAEYAERRDVRVGDSIEIDGDTHRIRAVLESDRAGIVSPDDAVFLPISAFDGRYRSVFVRASSPAVAFAAAERMDARLNPTQAERYHVVDAEESVERIRQQKARINLFLLGVGGISLFVAGVSILNVMLMSVIERREEIGVFRAVGYRRLDVVRLVLSEAALLGVVGATLGALASVGVGAVINAQFLGDPTAFSREALQYLAVGVAFGVGVSVLSGLYPAWKAANARPVEALRD
jgi:putative ABC transport system permease protein